MVLKRHVALRRVRGVARREVYGRRASRGAGSERHGVFLCYFRPGHRIMAHFGSGIAPGLSRSGSDLFRARLGGECKDVLAAVVAARAGLCVILVSAVRIVM